MLCSEGESSTLSTHANTEAKAVVNTKDGYILCPKCKRMTKTKTLQETELKRFPLYCKLCKEQFIIDYKGKQAN